MANVTVTYFEQPGPANTDATFEIAARRAKELGIDTIVVASTSGKTGVKAAEYFKGKKVVVVSHCAGFDKPNTQQMTEDNRKRILQQGATVVTATHALGGIGRAVRLQFSTYQVDEIVANALRLMGQGFKVTCEIVAMAADAGVIRTDQPVIAIAGKGEGSDTAIVVQPANVHAFFSMQVREVLCKPRVW